MTVLREFNPTTGFWDAIFVGAQGPQGVPGPPGTVNGAYNVKDFGAVGDGVADDRVAIQTALNACRVAGGGTVVIPPGTYSVSQAAHHQNASYQPCVVVGPKTRIQAHGATIKARTFTATGHLLLNYDITGSTDTDITIEGGLWDGSGGAQTQLTYGVTFMRITRATVRDATVINCRGTAASGSGETFHLCASLSTDVTFENCDVRGTAGSTASGFSLDVTTRGRIYNCRASGMTVGQGFTHNTCTDIIHVGCSAADNEMYGFNSEVSNNVRYVACTATGSTAGFTINDTTSASLVSCMGNNNAYGANFTVAATGSVVGGAYCDNSANGIAINNPSKTPVIGDPTMTGNASAPMTLPSGWLMNVKGFVGGPALPAADVQVINPYPFPAMVSVFGGTGTIIKVDGINTTLSSGFVSLPVGGKITIWYSGTAPTWYWFI